MPGAGRRYRARVMERPATHASHPGTVRLGCLKGSSGCYLVRASSAARIMGVGFAESASVRAERRYLVHLSHRRTSPIRARVRGLRYCHKSMTFSDRNQRNSPAHGIEVYVRLSSSGMVESIFLFLLAVHQGARHGSLY